MIRGTARWIDRHKNLLLECSRAVVSMAKYGQTERYWGGPRRALLVNALALRPLDSCRKSRSAPVLIAKLIFSGMLPVALAILIPSSFAATTPTIAPP